MIHMIHGGRLYAGQHSDGDIADERWTDLESTKGFVIEDIDLYKSGRCFGMPVLPE